jgi:hypothetical protein
MTRFRQGFGTAGEARRNDECLNDEFGFRRERCIVILNRVKHLMVTMRIT